MYLLVLRLAPLLAMFHQLVVSLHQERKDLLLLSKTSTVFLSQAVFRAIYAVPHNRNIFTLLSSFVPRSRFVVQGALRVARLETVL